MSSPCLTHCYGLSRSPGLLTTDDFPSPATPCWTDERSCADPDSPSLPELEVSGEHELTRTGASLSINGRSLRGTVVISSFRAEFVPARPDAGRRALHHLPCSFFSLPLSMISAVEKSRPGKTGICISLSTKDVRSWKLMLGNDNGDAVLSALLTAAFPYKSTMLFCFKAALSPVRSPRHGSKAEELINSLTWRMWDCGREAKRMGIAGEDSEFRQSSANADFVLCPSYPRQLLVPASASDEILRGSASFRGKGRIPGRP